MMTLLTLLLSVTMVMAGYYDGHQVLRVLPKLQSDVHAVVALGEELGVDFWHYPHSANDSFHVRVSPQVFDPFMTVMRSLGLEVTVMMDNVQEHVDREKASIRRRRSTASGSRNINFETYHTLNEIESYVDGLASTGNVEVSVEKLEPATVEFRNLRLVKISRSDSTATESIFVDCGIHAREWVTPAFCLYLIEKLMEGDNKVLDMYDWLIIPVANPDGYAYSHQGESQRMWRKNRNRNGNGLCYGVDLNRNFELGFGGEGTSGQKCSDLYRGTGAFSERESTAIKYATESRGNIKAYLNVHSYSQYWMTPWGYTHTPPQDIDELKCVGEIAKQAIFEKYGTEYQVGSPGELLYLAAGGSFDWVKGQLLVPYSYALELRDKGSYGFVLPVEQILPTVEETWDGVQAMAQAIFNNECN
ncbi:carboxypeptidase B-like [Mizuhopecten yessoensis]|uniref:Carboxypeptidase A2 n=1 Tax=Mizuhopecten yessoensis TaxID=6573 RepID=A0A210R2R9_MIZYE|nr:carboxypeptidase B-like [Mizuhopecten yessoensis]XP_021372082.1 carboxypeptidase B-like [Mizuhopecten yessoensis]OWF55234.1 Carboxypeptidase A2 [Mizuhopecten yessoensis]